MNRRGFLASAVSAAICSTAGCTEGGIFLGREGTPHADEVPLPELTGRDVSPEDAVTAFEIRWNALAAREFDHDPHDGRKATPADPDGILIVMAFIAENVGDNPHEFTPQSFRIEDGDDTYPIAGLHHLELTPFVRRTIDTNATTGGWVPFEVPADLSSGEIVVDEGDYGSSLAFRFEHDESVDLPV